MVRPWMQESLDLLTKNNKYGSLASGLLEAALYRQRESHFEFFKTDIILL